MTRDESGAREGQVAHSGMAKAPMQVQVFGESGRRFGDGGLSTPNHSVVLDTCPPTYGCFAAARNLNVSIPCVFHDLPHPHAKTLADAFERADGDVALATFDRTDPQRH